MDVWRFRAWEVLMMDTVDVSARVPVVGGGTSVCMPVAFFFSIDDVTVLKTILRVFMA